MTPHEQICEFGRQIHQRGFVAANDGNLSMRLEKGLFLCTPTMHCKGHLEPDDLCTVDAGGNIVEGKNKPSSEIRLHLEVYEKRPDVDAVVHCHPPHATAFAIAHEPVPQCVLPEVEIFLGEVPTAKYETPGTAEFARSIAPFVRESNAIILANHGTVSFGRTMRLAFWFTDILDRYCQTLILARQLGRIHRFGEEHCKQLLDYKQAWGFSDLRVHGTRAGQNVCGHEAFGQHWQESGVHQTAFPPEDKAMQAVPVNAADWTLTEEELDALAEKIVQKLA